MSVICCLGRGGPCTREGLGVKNLQIRGLGVRGLGGLCLGFAVQDLGWQRRPASESKILAAPDGVMKFHERSSSCSLAQRRLWASTPAPGDAICRAAAVLK